MEPRLPGSLSLTAINVFFYLSMLLKLLLSFFCILANQEQTFYSPGEGRFGYFEFFCLILTFFQSKTPSVDRNSDMLYSPVRIHTVVHWYTNDTWKTSTFGWKTSNSIDDCVPSTQNKSVSLCFGWKIRNHGWNLTFPTEG